VGLISIAYCSYEISWKSVTTGSQVETEHTKHTNVNTGLFRKESRQKTERIQRDLMNNIYLYLHCKSGKI
jgi:hypothetical protein